MGNSLDFGARIYDSRVARFLSLDPLAAKYPSLNPYNFVANSPLRFIDPDGKKIYDTKIKDTRYETIVSNVRSLDVMQDVLKNFEGNDYNITFDHGDLGDYRIRAETRFGRGENFNRKKDNPLRNSTITFNDNSLSYSKRYEAAGYEYKYKSTDIGIAARTMHEIYYPLIFKDVSNKKENLDNNQEHGVLAKKYRSTIVKALNEFNEKFADNKYSKQDIEILSWGGLENTEEFGQFLKDSEMTKEQYLQKAEILTSGPAEKEKLTNQPNQTNNNDK